MRKKLYFILLLAGLFWLTPSLLADWSTAKRLTWTPGESHLPAIAMDSSNVIHVVWYDNTPGNYEIYYKHSANGGTTWSVAKRLTWTSGLSSAPALAVDSGDVIHVVWQDNTPGNYEIYYKRSEDGGTTWSASKRLTWTSQGSHLPVIGIDSGDTIHVVWSDDTPGNADIYYKSSVDGGTTWSASKRLTWTSGKSSSPAMAIGAGDDIHIVWDDNTPEYGDIYYKGSTDGGSTWSATKRITWTSDKTHSPAIAMDSSGTIHVIWEDSTPGNLEIYYKRSADGGSTWSPLQRITWTSGSSSRPAIAIDSSETIHVVWYDDSSSNLDIYYKRCTDGGTTWGASQRITWTPGESHNPDVAVDSTDTIHVVWYDFTPFNYEIYYKNGN